MTQDRTSPVSPPTFEDAEKRVWTIKLTMTLIDRVLANTEVDLAPKDIQNIDPVINLLFDDRKLADVIWECITSQAESRKVTRENFRDALDGEALSKGWGAVVDAILFFIRSKSPKMAEALSEAVEIKMRFVEKGAAKIVESLKSQATNERLRARLDQIGEMMQKELESGLENSHTS